MKIVVVLVAVVMATVFWTGVNAQQHDDTVNAANFQKRFGDLDSNTVERHMRQMDSVEGKDGSNWIGWNSTLRKYYPIPYYNYKCEDGPFSRVLRDPKVFYWPPVYVYECAGKCPYKSPCIARKQVKRNVWTVQYKKFNVWGKFIWIATSVRKICVKDDTCCECQKCSDIKSYRKCVKTKPCPDTTNKNTFCYWTPKRKCDCCKETKCNSGQFFDRDRCKCRCNFRKCKKYYVQDPNTCKCVCSHKCLNKDIHCGRKRIFDSCSCTCKCKAFFCLKGRKPNFKTCHCDCPKKCIKPYVLNPATCKCVCPWYIKCKPGYYVHPRYCQCYSRKYRYYQG